MNVVRLLCMLLLAFGASGCVAKRATPDSALDAERKAVAYLIREVPAWSRECQCFFLV